MGQCTIIFHFHYVDLIFSTKIRWRSLLQAQNTSMAEETNTKKKKQMLLFTISRKFLRLQWPPAGNTEGPFAHLKVYMRELEGRMIRIYRCYLVLWK